MRVSRMMVSGLAALAIVGSVGAQTPLKGTLAVVNKKDGTVSLVDLATRAITATVPVGDGPHEVSVSPDGRFAIVSNFGPGALAGVSLSLIDIAQGSVERTITLGGRRRPHGLAWMPDGATVVVTVESDSALMLVDVASGALAAEIRLGQAGPDLLSLSVDGTRAYVTNLAASTVTIVDMAARRPLASVAVPKNADGVALRPGRDEIWVSSPTSNKITVLAAGDLAVRATIESGDFPMRVRFTPDGTRALVLFAKSSELKIFDAATRKETDVIAMRVSLASMHGGKAAEGYENHTVPLGIAVSPDGEWAFVTNGGVDAVSVVSLRDREVSAVIFVGREPDGVAYSPLVRAPAE